jgi:secreted trypsin-like serine protease
MRKSCWSALLTALAALAVLVSSASPAAAIVGGTTTDIGQFPYQVYLLVSDGGSTYFCGGSIRDALHVITARHCVFNLPATPGQPVAATKVTVVAGATSWRTPTGADVRRVAQVSYLPVPVGEPADAGDAALLTLAQPLSMTAAREQAIAFIGTDSIAASLWAPGRIATV